MNGKKKPNFYFLGKFQNLYFLTFLLSPDYFFSPYYPCFKVVEVARSEMLVCRPRQEPAVIWVPVASRWSPTSLTVVTSDLLTSGEAIFLQTTVADSLLIVSFLEQRLWTPDVGVSVWKSQLGSSLRNARTCSLTGTYNQLNLKWRWVGVLELTLSGYAVSLTDFFPPQCIPGVCGNAIHRCGTEWLHNQYHRYHHKYWCF